MGFSRTAPVAIPAGVNIGLKGLMIDYGPSCEKWGSKVAMLLGSFQICWQILSEIPFAFIKKKKLLKAKVSEHKLPSAVQKVG